MKLKVGQMLTNEELVNLFGNRKQIDAFYNNKKLSTKTKNALLKRLDCICMYEIIKIKRNINYRIIEIFKEKKELEEKRGGNNNSIYQEDFKNIMIYNLKNYPDKCKLLSKSSLCKMANLVNSNYTVGKRNIKELSTILEIDEDEVYDFYHNNHTKLTDIAERGMASCRKKSILTYNMVTVVAKITAKPKLNSLGEIIIENGKIKHEIEHEHRIATEEELEAILQVEQSVKKDMFGDENKDNRNIFLEKRWSEYKKNIKKRIKHEQLNISYYYAAYEINWIKSNIEKLYKEISDSYEHSSNKINKNILKSTKNTTESIINRKNNNKTVKKVVYKENYETNQNKLTKTLIDKNASYLGNDDELRIKAKIKNEEIENDRIK